jgi:dienelactone hydrolase
MTTRLLTRREQVIPVRIPITKAVLHGDLGVAHNALGIVIFVHGSGSSRFSPRNLHAAEELNKRGLSTLLLDLLTEEEQKIDAETMQYRFDIPFLVSRSTLAACWVRQQPELTRLPIGLFGASTGAAAALITAAVMKHQIAAVVSRGGRPDLAEDALKMVEAPTLLIVGGEDKTVLALNQQAATRLHCTNDLRVVPGATHLFEEPGALEQVVTLAAEWFVTHMRIHMLSQRSAC